jgi:hypothetical protein
MTKKKRQVIAVWQNGGFSAKLNIWFSNELLCKNEHLCFDFRHFAKLQNVSDYCRATQTKIKLWNIL